MEETTGQHVRTLREQMKRHLEEGIIPFWLDRAWDKTYGGFLTNFNQSGDPLPCPEKYLNTQCRLVWWFSRLCRVDPSNARYRELAEAGVEYLIKHFWDEVHGGWFWKIRQDGTCLDDGKVVYGQSFAIYALAEAAMALKESPALEYAVRTFDLLQIYTADTRHGGYIENLEPNWSPADPGFHGGDRKGLDTHMHLMESFTSLCAASGDPLHRRKLLEIVDLIAVKMVDPVFGCGLNQFTLAWEPIPAIAIRRTWNAERVGEAPAQPVETTSYGHNLELVWLMRLALKTADVDPAPYTRVMERLAQHALAHGVDWEYGGIYRDGLRDGGAIVLEKEFWQHAESLVGLLDAYIQFKDPRYLDACACLWNFIRDKMIASVGEWYTLLDRTGKIIDADLGNEWKVAYHTGRSMLECVERLSSIMLG